MIWLWFTIGFIGILLLFLLISLVCFIIVFYSKPRKKYKEGEYPLPKEKIYKPYYAQLIAWIENARKIKKDDFEITSFDGLKLRGKYYECKKGAPLEILFHGYRGDGERDVSAGIERCFALERNVIIVDQRASGTSQGSVITFGIKERFDCVKWAEFASEKFGKDTPIIISGVSMGASTVMMASKEKLPSNVKCVLADCGFTSPRDIIRKVISKDMKLPACIFYPFVKLGAKIFGRFNLEETSPLECVKQTNLPIIFIHGDKDDYVPTEMSRILFEATSSKKKLTIIENAGHGLAYPVNKQKYISALSEFEKEWR